MPTGTSKLEIRHSHLGFWLLAHKPWHQPPNYRVRGAAVIRELVRLTVRFGGPSCRVQAAGYSYASLEGCENFAVVLHDVEPEAERGAASHVFVSLAGEGDARFPVGEACGPGELDKSLQRQRSFVKVI